MKFLYLTVFFTLLLLFRAQEKPATIKVKKEVADSIDYTQIVNGVVYAPGKITQFKGEKIYTVKGQLFVYTFTSDTSPLSHLPRPKPGDTLISMNWDREEQLLCPEAAAQAFGRLKLNRHTNTLNITKRLYNASAKTFVTSTRLFKILKWTASEVILKDLSNLRYNRTFFLLRSS